MVPHEDDPVVISVVTVGRKVHRILIDQGSSTDVMFWVTFNNLWLLPDQLRPYDGCLYGFAEDQVEVCGHVELRTTLSNGTSAHTINIRYIVVNAVSAYNLLLGRPSLNRLGVMASMRHMKLKLTSLEGRLILIKSDQKVAWKCYENNMKRRRGVCSITIQARGPEKIMQTEVANKRRPGLASEVQEKEIQAWHVDMAGVASQDSRSDIEAHEHFCLVIGRHV